MRFRIEIDEELALVVAVVRDSFDGEGFKRYLDHIQALGPFPSGTDLLLVLHPDTRFEIETSELRAGAARGPTFEAAGIRVVLATDKLAYGLTRLYAGSAPTHGDQYRVVKTMADAASALGRDEALVAAAVERVDLGFTSSDSSGH